MPDFGTAFCVYFIFASVWVYQFALLMVLDDKTFPGAYDELIWGAAFLLAFPAAPFAFMVWKSIYKSYIQAKRREDGRD